MEKYVNLKKLCKYILLWKLMLNVKNEKEKNLYYNYFKYEKEK